MNAPTFLYKLNNVKGNKSLDRLNRSFAVLLIKERPRILIIVLLENMGFDTCSLEHKLGYSLDRSSIRRKSHLKY